VVRKKKENNGNDDKVVEPVVLSGKEIEGRLLEASSEADLDNIHKVLQLEGVPDGSIRGAISRLRKKGKLIFTTAVTEYEAGKPVPVEHIIKTIKLPEVGNGQGVIFNAGVEFGMKSLVAAVRLAQELSQMGIAQARPLISMATEMRKAEGMSAQEAGQRAAEDALAGAIQYLSTQKADIATVPNPMMGIIARAMEPAMTQLFGRVFAPFTGQPQTGGQPQSGSELPAGWVDKGKEAKGEETKR